MKKSFFLSWLSLLSHIRCLFSLCCFHCVLSLSMILELQIMLLMLLLFQFLVLPMMSLMFILLVYVDDVSTSNVFNAFSPIPMFLNSALKVPLVLSQILLFLLSLLLLLSLLIVLSLIWFSVDSSNELDCFSPEPFFKDSC